MLVLRGCFRDVICHCARILIFFSSLLIKFEDMAALQLGSWSGLVIQNSRISISPNILQLRRGMQNQDAQTFTDSSLFLPWDPDIGYFEGHPMS